MKHGDVFWVDLPDHGVGPERMATSRRKEKAVTSRRTPKLRPRCFQLLPPCGGFVGLAPAVVELDEAFQGFGQAGLDLAGI